MKLNIAIHGAKPVRLGTLKPGIEGIFCFIDSADHPEDLYGAIKDSGQNLFMVFTPVGKKKGGDVSIVSLDGKQILRRPASRQVRKISFGYDNLEWELEKAKSRASNVEPGKVVIVSPNEGKLAHESAFLCLVACREPSLPGKIVLIHFDIGTQCIIDEDMLVLAGTAHLNLGLKCI